jgi:hypothetical protein
VIVTLHVGVALSRPPVIDEYRRITVQADSEREASLIALQIASCTSVMPVSCEVVSIDEI